MIGPNLDVSKLYSDFFTERVWIAILFGGLALVVIAYYWLAARAVQASTWWRIGYLPPLAFFYLLSFSRRVVLPLLLMFIGVAVAATPYVATHFVDPLMRRHPWEKNNDGELHVTLTGLSNFDYAAIKNRKEIAVLQMANPDVKDETLANLRELTMLHELDINNTQVTDAGLAAIKALPNLKTLRIAKTKISDEGFAQHLFAIDRLTEIDARDTGIKGSTLRKWKNAKEGRKYLN